jgi:transposase
MAGVAVTRMELSADELRAAAKVARSPAAVRRILALALVLEGMDRETAARTCGMDRQTLRDWVHRYNSDGVAGLANRKSAGRPAKLTAEQKEAFKQLVEKGPDRAEDKVVRWRCADLKRRIETQFRIEVHERTVGKFLNALGYRRLSVRPQHPKSNPEAQETFKKTSPNLSPKASPRAPSPNPSRSGFRTKRASASRER